MLLVSEIKMKKYLFFDTISLLNDFIDQHKRFDSKLDTTGIAVNVSGDKLGSK